MRLKKLSRLARKNYLQISAFLDPVMIEQKDSSRFIKSYWRSYK